MKQWDSLMYLFEVISSDCSGFSSKNNCPSELASLYSYHNKIH